MAVNALGMTDDALSDAFERKTKEPRVQVATATPSTASDASGQPPAVVLSEREKKAGLESDKERLLAEEAKRKKGESEAKSAAEKARQAAIYEEYKPELTKKFQPFEAPKESFSSLAGIGMMLMAVGSMGGKKGLTSATGAMNAIAGMATGYQQGRKEEFDRQKAIFDENYKIMKDNQAQIEKEFQYALKYAKTDLTGASNYLKQQAIARGDKGFAAEVDKSGPVVAIGKQTSAARSGLTKAENDVLELNKKIRLSEARIADEEKRKTTMSSARPVEIINQEGKREAITVQEFNERRAKNEDMQIAPRQGASSAILQGRAENIREAFAQAAVDVKNITLLPKNTVIGTFAGLTGKSGEGLVDSIRNTFARNVTPQEQRFLQQLTAGLDSNLAFALGGGYATSQTKANIDRYKAQLAQEGDTPESYAMFLARVRQEMNTLAKNFPSKPGATKEMNDSVQEFNNVVNKSIPFTVEDVIKAAYPQTGGGGGAGKNKLPQRGLSIGEVKAGYKYTGGDPSDKDNWEKVQ
jgi:hypothetical protein